MRDKFLSEAAKCRNQAQEYLGLPEETFLLRVADVFEDLARLKLRQELDGQDRGHNPTGG